MSMDKAIKSGKEHRKEYCGCQYIDPSCRPHGGCEYCKGNRMYQWNKQKEKTNIALKEFENEDITDTDRD